jgi:hypothetical protein
MDPSLAKGGTIVQMKQLACVGVAANYLIIFYLIPVSVPIGLHLNLKTT